MNAKFIARIRLQNADEKDYSLLRKELQRKSFTTGAGQGKKPQTGKGLTFFKRGHIDGVVGEVLDAARKTGKLFSFTVIRNKAV